jgi:hypothetical protein
MELLESSFVRPRQARYQAALRPDVVGFYSSLLSELVTTAQETTVGLVRGIVKPISLFARRSREVR